MFLRVSADELRSLQREFSQKIHREQYNEMALPSYLHGNPLIRWLVWRRNELIMRAVEKVPHDAVLDFGSGFGVLLPSLCATAKKVFAIDIVPEPSQMMAKMRKLDVQFMASLDAVPARSLDVIIASEVLEHVEDVPALARSFAAKLKPTGCVVVSGPTESVAYKVGRFVAGFGTAGDHHHRQVDDIRNDFASAGFDVKPFANLPTSLMPLFKLFTAHPKVLQ